MNEIIDNIRENCLKFSKYKEFQAIEQAIKYALESEQQAAKKIYEVADLKGIYNEMDDFIEDYKDFFEIFDLDIKYFLNDALNDHKQEIRDYLDNY